MERQRYRHLDDDVIDLRAADPPDCTTDQEWECAVMGAPLHDGGQFHIDADVVASDGVKCAHWTCHYFGHSAELPLVTQSGGDVVPWRCELIKRDGALVLTIAGEANHVVRWWLTGTVRVYA